MTENLKKYFNDAWNIPNLFSFIRLLLAIPILFCFLNFYQIQNVKFYIGGLILLAFITDLLDGFLARKLNKISEFGKIIDPLADKTLMIIIVTQLYLLNFIPGLFFWIIIGRDILIFFTGIIVSRKIGKVLPSNLLGKITVFTIGLFILIVLAGVEPANFIYRFLFYVSIFLSFSSIIAYALRAYEALKWNKNEHI